MTDTDPERADTVPPLLPLTADQVRDIRERCHPSIAADYEAEWREMCDAGACGGCALCEGVPTPLFSKETVLRLCDTVDSLRVRVDELKDSEQGWVDRSVYYRNVAVEAGAEPGKFDDAYDQALARDETLCCPCEAEVRADLATALRQLEVAQDTLKVAEESERTLQLDLLEALRERDERPAGRVLLRRPTYRHVDSLERSAVSGYEVDVPPGTEVAVVVVTNSGEVE